MCIRDRYQSISEAKTSPDKESLIRAWTAQYTVMENANEIAQLAIRTCGGQAMLRSLHLERLYRDSRCGALMLPYTTEIMEDYLSMMSVYDMDEVDTAPNDTVSARTSLWRPYQGDESSDNKQQNTA